MEWSAINSDYLAYKIVELINPDTSDRQIFGKFTCVVTGKTRELFYKPLTGILVSYFHRLGKVSKVDREKGLKCTAVLD